MLVRMMTVCLAIAPLTSASGDVDGIPGAASLPIREVTAFKDGHALVLRAGEAPVSLDDGGVTLEDLPRPIMGAFWADSPQPDARLASVTVERVNAPTPHEAKRLEDLLLANIGRTIIFSVGDQLRSGVLLHVLEDRHEPAAPPMVWNGRAWTPRTPVHPPANLVALIQEDDAVAALPVNRLQDIRFVGEAPARRYTRQTPRERMTLGFAWDGAPAEAADVSLMYIQRGLRWIPSYRITMLGEGRVRIELQATLVNELADLDGVTMHLAVGTPSFAFEGTPDPMAMREQFDDLGFYFRRTDGASTGAMLNNALFAQGARRGDFVGASTMADAPAAQGGQAPPDFLGGERAEDLFIFTLSDVTLARGARMVLSAIEYEAEANSLYTLELPGSPPTQALERFNNDQHRQLARLLNNPTPRHVLRIQNKNDGGYPITTAPALVVRNGRTLAQGLLTYTAHGASVDLEVGAAVDISVETDEREALREPDALRWNGRDYARIDITFEAELTNHKTHPTSIEVRKLAFGSPDSVGQGGEAVARSVFSDEVQGRSTASHWWRWWSWPSYWHRLNGAAEFTWTIELAPGETKALDAAWRYFWN